MNKKLLTEENLKRLIAISMSFNEFQNNYITWDLVNKANPVDTLMSILYFSNFELFEVREFKELAEEIVFSRDLELMPLLVNENEGCSQILNTTGKFTSYAWIPVVARWRLEIGI